MELKDRAIVRIHEDGLDVSFLRGRHMPIIIPDQFTFIIHRGVDGSLARIDFYDLKGNHVFACNKDHVVVDGPKGQETFTFLEGTNP